jgi:hypothetical protein
MREIEQEVPLGLKILRKFAIWLADDIRIRAKRRRLMVDLKKWGNQALHKNITVKTTVGRTDMRTEEAERERGTIYLDRKSPVAKHLTCIVALLI